MNAKACLLGGIFRLERGQPQYSGYLALLDTCKGGSYLNIVKSGCKPCPLQSVQSVLRECRAQSI